MSAKLTLRYSTSKQGLEDLYEIIDSEGYVVSDEPKPWDEAKAAMGVKQASLDAEATARGAMAAFVEQHEPAINEALQDVLAHGVGIFRVGPEFFDAPRPVRVLDMDAVEFEWEWKAHHASVSDYWPVQFLTREEFAKLHPELADQPIKVNRIPPFPGRSE